MDSISSRRQQLLEESRRERQLHIRRYIPYIDERVGKVLFNTLDENVRRQMLEETLRNVDVLDKKLDDKLSMIIKYEINDVEELDKAIHNIRPSHFANLVLFRAKNCDHEKLNEFMAILIKRSNKLEAIKIENCTDLYYLFDIEGFRSNEDGKGKYLTLMKELELTGLKNLEKIWEPNPYGILDLRNLQKVHIKSCPFLKFIFYSHGADRLCQLMELKLEACEWLREIVRHDAEKELVIRFVALSKVVFKSLSSLEVFYYHHLEFPNLQTLMIEDCPKLIEFTTGFATANAMDTIDDKSFSELNELQLDNCKRLVYVIHSKTLQEFRNLKKLTVTHCEALKMVFHIDGEIPDLSELLQQLDELTLTYLSNLTHIINGKIYMFSQLKDVSLKNLTMLSYAFPSTCEFPSLETLKIANCPIMKTFVEESNKVKTESVTSNCFFPNSRRALKEIPEDSKKQSCEEPLKEEVQDKGDGML
ncbi:hypothetical protein Fmac_027039 [Flemingia macrophylla]|uniref:Disease resistance protein At4g27190-like leucine-rich repeats domain-containing protein n=1 Tax=Flemingia macrophylla TaxID=520843 RepID=A0ABD1LGJ5_9FABA